MARPKGTTKPEGEKLVSHQMRWTPELWERLCAAVPERQRSRFVREAVDRALKAQERREKAKG
jgi:hypothetical protein